MSTYTKILYQIVFGSKRRSKFFDKTSQEKLFNYVAGISAGKNCFPYKIGGDTNHLHLLVSLHKTESLSGFVREVKKASHKWIITHQNLYKNFPGCQKGYSGFTYSYSALKELKKYIENQNEHHKIETFEEEYINFLEEHGIEFDQRYIWE